MAITRTERHRAGYVPHTVSGLSHPGIIGDYYIVY